MVEEQQVLPEMALEALQGVPYRNEVFRMPTPRRLAARDVIKPVVRPDGAVGIFAKGVWVCV
jgi:hypothetical protein